MFVIYIFNTIKEKSDIKACLNADGNDVVERERLRMQKRKRIVEIKSLSRQREMALGSSGGADRWKSGKGTLLSPKQEEGQSIWTLIRW